MRDEEDKRTQKWRQKANLSWTCPRRARPKPRPAPASARLAILRRKNIPRAQPSQLPAHTGREHVLVRLRSRRSQHPFRRTPALARRLRMRPPGLQRHLRSHQKSRESNAGSRMVSCLGSRLLSVGGSRVESKEIPQPRRSSIVRCLLS